jgi:acetamidase/formamidase
MRIEKAGGGPGEPVGGSSDKQGSIVSVFADKPLEAAVETATFNLMDWLITEYGFTPTDAYCLVSTCPDFRINVYQMCKIAKLMYVAGAEIPRKYLTS